MYQKNDELIVTIEDQGINGEGIGKESGYALFVKDTVIGDKCKVKIMKAKKNYAFAKLLEIIEQLSKLGLAVIMSSHYPDHAFLAASKVAIMKDKGFIDFGTPDDVLSEENLKKAYGIDVKLMELDDGRKICVPLKTNLELKSLNSIYRNNGVD